MKRFRKIQPVLAYAARHLEDDVSLAALARRAGLSAYHLHRAFARAAGETPKQYTQRLRLERAAALLLTERDSVLEVALACGFRSHEAFLRGFRRQFGMTPGTYRRRGFFQGVRTREHAALVQQAGPCLGLYHIREESRPKQMAYSIEKRELKVQPVLLIRRRIAASEIAATLGPAYGRIFQYALENGMAIAGQPIARYVEWGPGMLTLEAALPVAAPGKGSADGEIVADTLPGGPAAVTTHAGPYDKLTEAHAALQVWIEGQGMKPKSAPWEVYVTDPADYPNPQDWKTDVVWPLSGD